MSISVVINTKNAAKTLGTALDSIAFADEVIIVDMHSTDVTADLAKKRGAKVYFAEDVGYVEPARELALSKVTSEWVLVLDADEVVPASLSIKLQEIASGQFLDIEEADCYYLARRNQIWGQWLQHTGWWPDYILRFFRKGFVKWPAELHSVPITKGKVAQLPAQVELALEHYNYPSISSYIQRLDRYTTIQAEEKTSNYKAVSSIDIFKAFREEFVRRFAAEQGFLDKQAGVGLSLWQALSEVTVVLKIWENQGFKADKKVNVTELISEFTQLTQELKYWTADYQVRKSSGITKLYWRYRRKFRI